jgi:hypothetical protein
MYSIICRLYDHNFNLFFLSVNIFSYTIGQFQFLFSVPLPLIYNWYSIILLLHNHRALSTKKLSWIFVIMKAVDKLKILFCIHICPHVTYLRLPLSRIHPLLWPYVLSFTNRLISSIQAVERNTASGL